MRTLAWAVFGAFLLLGSVALGRYLAGLAPIPAIDDDALATAQLVARAEPAAHREEVGGERLRPSADPANGPVVVGFGHVDIESGTTPLTFSTFGPVAEVLVHEGQHVTAHQPLIKLDARQAEAQVALGQAAVREAEVGLEQAKRAPDDHAIRLSQQQQVVAAAKARVEAQRRQVERLEKLSRDAAVPDENYQSANDRLAELQAARTIEELKLEQAQLEKPEEQLAVAQANLAAAKAKLAIAEDALARQTLSAPENGRILRVHVNKGQMVGAAQQTPAVWFCADRPPIVRCEIDQEFANRVEVGMPAEIHDDSTSGVTWKGRVQRIGDWVAPRRSTLDEPFQKNDVRTLECLIAIDPGQTPVRIGQRLRVVLKQSAEPPAPAVAGRR